MKHNRMQYPTGSAWCLTLSFSLGLFATPWGALGADPPTRMAAATALQEGSQLSINGQPVAGAWAQWINPQSGQSVVGVSDSVWMRSLGGELADSLTPAQQPVQWYSATPVSLATQFGAQGAMRYLAISDFARQQGWQVQANGAVLNLQMPASTVQSVRLGQQPWGRRLVVTLDRPTPWNMASLTNSRTGRTDRQFKVQVQASLAPTLLKGWTVKPGTGLKALQILPGQGKATIQGTLDGTFQPQVWTLENPPRLVLDIRQTPLKPRRITWAPGLVWREDLVTVGTTQFPVTWLSINPRQPGLQLQPFWGESNALVGMDHLAAMSDRNRAAATINAGFFSRDRQTPLGAIRRNGTWMSSPILNRGAIAWNPQGQFKVGRLMLQEWLVASQGSSLAIASSNSGYPQKGMARYTSLWGPTYTPLLKNEQIVTVLNNQVQSIQPGQDGVAVPIPGNGAVLALRAIPIPPELAVGMQLQYQMRSLSPNFESFPNIMGAGPLLIENGQIVVNAIAEQFSPTFAQQAADRSGIGQTGDGTVLLTVTHNRVGGAGPTLPEWAQVMQKLGAVNALNLDGGSSTALYLGGQLLDRHPVTAARVQNGIGVFFNPPLDN